ncbi:MAG: helix-turn-helix transcriptional regulator [Burkholderiales bacterium]|nr:helix-turn-helix transcriptional regulator [Burkholderiales bacterium]
MHDWMNVVEAGYDLSLSPQAWLQQLLVRATPLMDRGAGVNAQLFRVSATRFALEHVAVHGHMTAEQLRGFLASAPAEAINLVYRHGLPAGSLSESMFASTTGRPPSRPAELERYFIEESPDNFQDSLGMTAHTGTGWGVVLAVPLPHPQGMAETERRHWKRVAAHLAAGLRLRLGIEQAALEEPAVEAVLVPDGKLKHAERSAQSPSAQQRLRDAVRAVDRARTRKHRADTEAALQLWEGLVAGRWSLVDRFDSDGRRFVVAMRNDPAQPDPRGLTRRERQVAEYCGMKRSTKDIAYLLGLSASAVGGALSEATRKLGLNSRTELAAFFAPAGLRARLAEWDLHGQNMALGAYPLAQAKQLEALSEGERAVAMLLLQGETYTAIAHQRGSAERTVANQVQAIYRKLGVRSRVELAAELGRPGSASSAAGDESS